jgi:DNA-binding response OmpR family regulator
MKRIRVLVVDDDEDFAQSLAMLLKSRGYEIELAYSGEEAIEKSYKQHFDITFMDVMLPGKSGVESFTEIRQFKPKAKVVMMTGFSLEEILDEAMEKGAWGIFNKPLNVKKMLEMLEKLRAEHILLVDDDPDFVNSIKILLEKNGKTVFTAKDGKEAVECACSNDIDILFLDLRIPILSGLETCLELKKTGHTIPTIIVTAYADQETEAIETLKCMSITRILRKPFDPKELLEAVGQLSNKNRN